MHERLKTDWKGEKEGRKKNIVRCRNRRREVGMKKKN